MNRQSQSSSQPYADAKRSSVDENIFGPSSLSAITGASAIASSRNLDFERAKQKFDRPITSSSSRNKKTRNFSSFLKFSNKRSDPSPSDNDVYSSPRNSQYIDGELTELKLNDNECLVGHKKKDYMNSSMNLDGLKVSEDDDDVSKML